jgi:EipB-like
MTYRLAFLTALFLAAPFGGAIADTPPLASHRAVYELSLDKAAGSKAPAQARGRIVFDFTASCEGYIQNFRQITELQPAEGATKLSDMISATYEALDAGDYRFKVETKVDSGAKEEVDGKARKAKDARIAVDLTRPKRGHLDLDGPAFFPSEHLLRIIKAALAGESLIEARVYDGTGDGDKAFDTLTVIGKPIEAPAAEKAAQADGLKGMKRWRVAVSYFETGKRDGQPLYVLSFDLYENGVSRALTLDYGDFTLKGDMKELALQPAVNCKK